MQVILKQAADAEWWRLKTFKFHAWMREKRNFHFSLGRLFFVAGIHDELLVPEFPAQTDTEVVVADIRPLVDIIQTGKREADMRENAQSVSGFITRLKDPVGRITAIVIVSEFHGPGNGPAGIGVEGFGPFELEVQCGAGPDESMVRFGGKIELQGHRGFQGMHPGVIISGRGIRGELELGESDLVAFHAVVDGRRKIELRFKLDLHANACLKTVFESGFLFLIFDFITYGAGLGPGKNGPFHLADGEKWKDQEEQGGGNEFHVLLRLKVVVRIAAGKI